MEQFLSFLIFDTLGIVFLSCLFLVFSIQTFYYSFYYRLPLSKAKKISFNPKSEFELPSVSVVIIVKDDSRNLEKNLPLILNQDYPNYEVIVVNDGSTDETDMLLKKMKLEYPHLYSTFSPSSYQSESRRQKVLSLTIGIKAATKDILLFTEIDCHPVDNKWISSMMRNLTPNKDIVLGYCRYTKEKKTMWSRIALFDHLIFSLQYLSMAIRNKPFTGVHRNMAYRKELFFNNKGFSTSLRYDNADEVFLNQIVNTKNTAISLDQSSFVSCELEYYSMWKYMKIGYMKAKNNFQNYTPSIFHGESITRYLFYSLFICTTAYTIYNSLWLYLGGGVLLFLIRLIYQCIVLGKSAKYFEMDLSLMALPLIDVAQPIYNSSFHNHSKKKRKGLFK